ncbi:MAG: exostosin family protein [Capsulimonadaceae bacterium]
MEIFLLNPKDIDPTLTDLENMPFTAFHDYSLLDRHGEHKITASVNEADLIICPTPSRSAGVIFYELSRSRIFRKHCNRIFVFCNDDIVMPRLPGLYPGTTPMWAKLGWTSGAHYITNVITKFGFTDEEIRNLNRQVLFSFVGSAMTHPIRTRIISIQHPRSLIHNSTNTRGDYWWRCTEEERARFHNLFRESLISSKFILCPRGKNASSIRTFEALESGAVPVIIADDIVLPEGPDWNEIALRVPEGDISNVPSIIERNEGRFPKMSAAGRSAWEDYFAPETSFHTTVEYCRRLDRGLSHSRRRQLSRMALIHSWTNIDCVRARMRFLKLRLFNK